MIKDLVSHLMATMVFKTMKRPRNVTDGVIPGDVVTMH